MDRFDEFAKHYIDLEFSGNTVSEYMSDMLNDMENDINDYISDEKSVPTKNAYNRITDYINKSISDYSDKVKEYINKIVNKTIKMEDKWITGMLSASIAADIIIPKINFMPFNTIHNRSDIISSFPNDPFKCCIGSLKMILRLRLYQSS